LSKCNSDSFKMAVLQDLMVVKTCSKAISALCGRHGKSPCFYDVAFLRLLGPDYPLLVLPSVNGQENMECTFCYGTQ
jgi:hypothetical protein